MTREDISDETLMAHADGELEPTEAARVAERVRTDPEVARRLARFVVTRDRLRGAGAARAEEPLPEGFEARMRDTIAARHADGDAVASLGAARAAQRPGAGWYPAAAAACLALAVGLAGGYRLGQPGDTGEDASGGFARIDAGVAAALASLPSGETAELDGGREIAPVASFEGADGALCREYEMHASGQRTVSVACAEENSWSLRFAMDAGGAQDEAYAPASSLEVLDAYYMSSGAGAPLPPEDEAEALARLR
ncbi:hypothetical protein OCH239_15330 [Roseivivax halodurans JCM 10272]|uniref:Anti-sigma factor n=1 Tax=Roseivivax halodurans JCM 10272 TaxID=1449350 RepID=X7ECT9_9RHOB|nr:hypothetical protein [Roseivivax halodurans]ETX12908.1 hypothetical protein OCH239_15330 [Roseivivax halodurans JCM 10272]